MQLSTEEAVFRFTDGSVLIFDDVRRFGTVEHLDADARSERSAAMGPEPLSGDWREDDLEVQHLRSAVRR